MLVILRFGFCKKRHLVSLTLNSKVKNKMVNKLLISTIIHILIYVFCFFILSKIKNKCKKEKESAITKLGEQNWNKKEKLILFIRKYMILVFIFCYLAINQL